jgi:hypothetical protein
MNESKILLSMQIINLICYSYFSARIQSQKYITFTFNIFVCFYFFGCRYEFYIYTISSLSPRKFKRFPTLRSYDFPLFLRLLMKIFCFVTKSFARTRSKKKSELRFIFHQTLKRHFNLREKKAVEKREIIERVKYK